MLCACFTGKRVGYIKYKKKVRVYGMSILELLHQPFIKIGLKGAFPAEFTRNFVYSTFPYILYLFKLYKQNKNEIRRKGVKYAINYLLNLELHYISLDTLQTF